MIVIICLVKIKQMCKEDSILLSKYIDPWQNVEYLKYFRYIDSFPLEWFLIVHSLTLQFINIIVKNVWAL